MKILLIHKFHYMLGGTETFHYNLADALTKAGHEVIFFSMIDERNIPCKEDKYFVSNVNFNATDLTMIDKIKLGFKIIYSFEAKKKIEQLIIDERPDIAHIGLLHRQITFSVIDVLRKHNIPTIMHLHELTSVCPCYTMLRPDGSICSKCASDGYWNCVRNSCIKNSKAKSIVGYVEAKFLKYCHYYDKIDLYIAECSFYKKLIEEADITKSPIIKMNNFLPLNQEYKSYLNHENYILYFGRFSREKGVITLLEAFLLAQCSEKLMLVGEGSEKKQIENFVSENHLKDKVVIRGAIFGDEMERIIERAKIVVVPSQWYENGAFVALQAIAKGKIVVASNIAGLAEIFEDGETGFLAEPGNSESFAAVIKKALSLSKEEYETMSGRVVEYAKKRCDANVYIEELLHTYKKVIATRENNE